MADDVKVDSEAAAASAAVSEYSTWSRELLTVFNVTTVAHRADVRQLGDQLERLSAWFT
jgi:hypothetical protein